LPYVDYNISDVLHETNSTENFIIDETEYANLGSSLGQHPYFKIYDSITGSTNESYRYKPRYFFNLLMKEVATDTQAWTLNDQQIATTDANGEWDGQIWVATEEGEYDIIVDIGSPTTPDDTIHFAFSGTNVMDGFDGRTEPGFMVKDNGIDVVVALDVLAANSKALQSNK